MTVVMNIGDAYWSLRPLYSRRNGPAAESQSRHAVAKDGVKSGGFSATLARAAETSSFQDARTRAIGAEIENGTYETPARINATVERLLDVIA